MVSLANETAVPIDEARVRRLVERSFSHTGSNLVSVAVSLVTEPTIQKCNRDHRGKDSPTDVLSYPFDGSFPQGSGGEVLVCPDIAATQADKKGIPLESEIDYLIVHGALHLAGYTDDTESGRAEMERYTKEILRKASHG